MRRPWHSILLLVVLTICGVLRAAEVIPPRPAHYFNDYAHIVSVPTATALNLKLEQFERDTSNQIVVAIYPKMLSDSAVEDYTVRVAQNWHVGQKDKNNGAVLFVFSGDHKVYLQVGYGLEAVIPDVTAKRIVADRITPAFHAGNFDAGLTAGVDALLAAAKGEYKGTGTTVQDRALNVLSLALSHPKLTLFLIAVAYLMLTSFFRHATVYRAGGRSSSWGWQVGDALLNIAVNAALSGGSSRSSGSGGGGGGGGGGFSSGGGSFGGGGAGGSW